MKLCAIRSATTLASLLLALPALAHEGHGLPGASHWHSGDVSLWLFGAVFAAGVAWLARRK